MTLEAALEIAKTLHGKIGRAKIKPEVAVGAIGYSGLNGAALTTLGTLTSYGLVERDRGVGLTVSPLAIQMIHPTDRHQERFSKAQSALMPKVFMELFTDGFHNTDESVIRNHLIQKGFTTDGATKAASVYMANFGFAELGEFRSHGDMLNAKKAQIDSTDEGSEQKEEGKVITEEGGVAHKRVLAKHSIPLGANEATLIITGDGLCLEDFDALIEYVQLFKKQHERKVKNEVLMSAANQDLALAG